jgi:hypothetical protein
MRLYWKDKSDAGNAKSAFVNLGQRKYKCPNRLRKLIRLIDGHQVPAIANNLDVCSWNPGEYLTPVLLQWILSGMAPAKTNVGTAMFPSGDRCRQHLRGSPSMDHDRCLARGNDPAFDQMESL